MNKKHYENRTVWRLTGFLSLLALGFAIWQSLGMPGIKQWSRDADFAARVNDHIIPADALRRALDAVQADRRQALTAADKKRVLDILIAEELLLQQANRLGLAQSDQGARKAIIDAMMQVIMNNTDRPPAPGELESWYRENGDILANPVRLQLLALPAGDKAGLFNDLILAGTGFRQAATNSGIKGLISTGNKYLPEKGLINILPPVVVKAVLPLKEGDITGPVSKDNWFLWLTGKKGGTIPPLEDARELAEFQWLRQRQDAAVNDYIQTLHQQSEIFLPGTATSP